MRSIKLSRKGTRYVVAVVDDSDNVTQYVVCRNYNGNAKYGEQWDFGHYFFNLEDAVLYFLDENLSNPV